MTWGATVTAVTAHVLGAQWIEDTLVGIVIALLLFALYYRFVLVRANTGRVRRFSVERERDGNDSGD